MSKNKATTLKTREHKPSKIGTAVKAWFHKGPIFKAVTYVLQISLFFSVAYALASTVATLLLTDVVHAFGAYAVQVTGAAKFSELLLGDLFGFFMLPSAFAMLVIFAGYIAVVVGFWRMTNRWFDRMCKKREADLQKRYAE